MLPARHRMRRSPDFREAVRRGRRAGSRSLAVHLLLPAAPSDRPALVGLVVPRAVGGAVDRTRVKRRLRHVLAGRLGELPGGARLVVRAAAPASAVTSAELASDLDRALRAVRRGRVSGGSGGSGASGPPGGQRGRVAPSPSGAR